MTGSAAFPARDVAALLGALEPGRSLWVRGLGRSMWPLLPSGAEVRLRRCEPGAFSPGDVAFCVLPSGEPVVHLLLGTQPVRTAGWLRSEDAPGGTMLARVEAVRVKGQEVRLPGGLGPLLLLARATARRPLLLAGLRPLARRLGR